MSTQSPDEHPHLKKKRVGKACDSCRIKKTKCDGKKPCLRCIADNKLCGFSEKKKHKEKNHPLGYIDLLETRLDLLTKLLEKIIQMAEPHLPVIHNLVVRTRAQHAVMPSEEDADVLDANYVPINEVVLFLISDMGLLENAPVEWERGADIAAKLLPTNVDESARDFAKHKLSVGDTDLSLQLAPEKLLAHLRTNSLLSEDLTVTHQNLLTEHLNLDNILLGGFQNSDGLTLDAFPKRANLLFLNTEGASLLLLLALLRLRFERHDLDAALPLAFVRRLVSLKGPLLPSHQKNKLNGHVHKHRTFNALSPSSFVANNGNAFHLFTDQYALLISDFGPTVKTEEQKPNLFYDLLFDDTPSRDYDFPYTKPMDVTEGFGAAYR